MNCNTIKKASNGTRTQEKKQNKNKRNKGALRGAENRKINQKLCTAARLLL